MATRRCVLLFTTDKIYMKRASIFRKNNSLLLRLPSDMTGEKCFLFSNEMESIFSINNGFNVCKKILFFLLAIQQGGQIPMLFPSNNLELLNMSSVFFCNKSESSRYSA